uniref:ZNF380 coiled-coil domain-containing protein n=1 Tax=Clastoptera arizonana TaxID=38151 RepID=A0A1B6EC79_9HEMI
MLHQKKLKSILKNGPKPELPEGFFDSKDKMDTEVRNDLETTTEALHNAQIKETPDVQQEGDLVEQSELLPEGFFDDPVLDAKARNVEYRDPIQEEWERFQKEIKEESTVSTQIIQDDQEEATAERQIQEIDEQMRNWSRVLDLEVKKEKVQSVVTKNTNEDMDQESSDEGDDFDEFLDWRSKKII